MKRILVIVAAVLVVAAIAVAGYTRAGERVVSTAYSRAKAGTKVAGTGFCVSVDLRSTLRARTAPSGLLGWSQAEVVNPQLRASVQPCTDVAYGALEQIVVSEQWVPRSCRLQGVSGEDFAEDSDEADQADADDLAPWRLQTGDCTEVPVATYRFSGPQLSVSGDTGTARFRGRAWGRSLCLTPVVYVQVSVKEDDQASINGVPVTLPDACVSR